MGADLHYSMMIPWSDEDQAYVVSFPEWEAHGLIGHTHGDTYAEASRKGQGVLSMLVRSAHEEGEPLPAPQTFDRHNVESEMPAPTAP
jgi:predicted RNase H-like HicB family nuclease